MTNEIDPAALLADAANGRVVHYEPLAYLGPQEAELRRERRRAAHELALDLAGLRRALGVTQVELAEAAETTQPNISRIERDAASLRLSSLVDYLAALGAHATLHVERDGVTHEFALL